MQIVYHFIQGTWASVDLGMGGGPGTNPEGQLYTFLCLIQMLTDILEEDQDTNFSYQKS